MNLKYNGLGPEGGKAIGEALKVNASMTSLNAQNNQLGSEGEEALREAVGGREGFKLIV